MRKISLLVMFLFLYVVVVLFRSVPTWSAIVELRLCSENSHQRFHCWKYSEHNQHCADAAAVTLVEQEAAAAFHARVQMKMLMCAAQRGMLIKVHL